MRTLTYIFCATLILFIAGCIYVPPVWDVGDEIHSVDQIQIGATTRDKVLELLGEPDRGAKNDRITIYRGRLSKGAVIYGSPAMVGGGGGYLDPQDWRIAIYFDENDVVQELATWQWSSYDTEPEFVLAELEKRARGVDPEGAYEYATKLKASDAWRWHCLAAQRGHAKARWKMGLFYRSDYWGLEPNLVLAYVWYTLSFEAGYATAEQNRDRLSQEMTPDQIAEAERLVAEWEPNLAECEIEVTPTLEAIEIRARSGDPAAQYAYAYHLHDFEKSWRWYCLAANQGHGKARYAVGNFYRSGLGPVTQDLAKAYLWYALAGPAAKQRSRDKLAAGMTPDQIAEAERLVAEWEPNPEECEVKTSQSAN